MARLSDRGGTVHPSWLAVLSDPVRLSLLRCLGEMETATAAQLAPRAHASERTLRRHLDTLIALGLAREHRGESDGQTQGRPAASYSLPAVARGQVTALFDLLSQPLGLAGQPSSETPRGQ